MGLLRNLIIGILTISFLTFVAFFGRLPAFRNTPISWLHRFIWLHIPSGFRHLDAKLTRGRLSNYSIRLVDYLMNEKHPLVVIFFLGLLTGASSIFLWDAWHLLPPKHHILIPILLPLPYLFSYLCGRAHPANIIMGFNHSEHMRIYPYDRVLYYPGHICRTCHFLKPARSKHCSICKVCISRADHHCVWVNNCLGKENYRWFLLLLLSTGVVLAYGAYLAYIVLDPEIRSFKKEMEMYNRVYRPHQLYQNAPPVSGESLFSRLGELINYAGDMLGIAIGLGGLSVAGVGMLAVMTWPLPLGLLGYHLYLIWAGMTINESGKWADWRDDMYDGAVFLGHQILRDDDVREQPLIIPIIRISPEEENGAGIGDPQAKTGEVVLRGSSAEASRATSPGRESAAEESRRRRRQQEPPTDWPIQSKYVLVRTLDGLPPRHLPESLRSVVDESTWRRCWRLAEVENIYDLGFLDNLIDVFKG